MTKIPEEICNLSNLIRLELGSNKLVKLPRDFMKLKSLKHLGLGGNNFTKNPISDLHLFKNLEVLWLWDIPMNSFPSQVFKLRNLQKLSLCGNGLTHLPEAISSLTQLEYLVFHTNKLIELPISVAYLNKLEEINLDHNPLKFPPSDIVNLGIPAIKSYLLAAEKKSIHVYMSRALILGEGGVGKTTLFEVLSERSFDEHEPGTVGIEIGTLNLSHPDKEDATMHLNCWDFAGQDFNHAMHQFFFSNRALFLLVWNARHGWQQGKLYRWLENIKVRAPESKVILVATHTDQPHSDYPAAELQGKYPQIVATIEVSSKTGDNISELRHLIQQHAANLPLMGLRWPQTWLDAANAVRDLREVGRLHASRREIVEIMQTHGLNEQESDILMRWLHELGDILYFQDEPDMRGRIILNPEWLTQHVGIILRSDEVAAQHGILTRSHLNSLWPDLDDYLQDHFLRIMDKFDLAYLIPDDPQDRSLIVERLPLDPPDFEPQWNDFKEKGNQITLRFKLGSMQPGIPTWFIARCHRFTMNTHWLNGVLFKDEEDRHRALVIADDQQNTVQMTVRGPFPQRFMSLLRDGFRDTLKRYKGLEVERWVPCPGYNELEEKPCENEFRLAILESWLEKKPDRITFTCPDCDTELSRLQLVEGIGAAALTQPFTEQRMEEMLEAAHSKTRKEIKEHIDYSLEDVIKYQERNFLRAFYLEQDRELVWCPNLFTVRLVPNKGIVKKQEWHIQLYCQQPGTWHPVGDPYIIEEQKEWFTKSLPYLKTLFKVLSFVAPLAGASLAITDVAGDKIEWAQEQQKIFANEVKMMGELLKGVETIKDLELSMGERMNELPERSTFQKFEGADLVPIRELMDQLADMDKEKGRPKWAGLTRRQTPEGDILWLDQEHLQEYLSKRPIVALPEDE